MLGTALGAPVDLFAALGFVAVFAGATNTPLACTLMGIELFGADAAVYIAATCFFAYLVSGHSGIYLSQRVGMPKGDTDTPGAGVPASLRAVRDVRRAERPSRRERRAVATAVVRDGSTSLPQRSVPHRHHVRPRPGAD